MPTGPRASGSPPPLWQVRAALSGCLSSHTPGLSQSLIPRDDATLQACSPRPSPPGHTLRSSSHSEQLLAHRGMWTGSRVCCPPAGPGQWAQPRSAGAPVQTGCRGAAGSLCLPGLVRASSWLSLASELEEGGAACCSAAWLPGLPEASPGPQEKQECEGDGARAALGGAVWERHCGRSPFRTRKSRALRACGDLQALGDTPPGNGAPDTCRLGRGAENTRGGRQALATRRVPGPLPAAQTHPRAAGARRGAEAAAGGTYAATRARRGRPTLRGREPRRGRRPGQRGGRRAPPGPGRAAAGAQGGLGDKQAPLPPPGDKLRAPPTLRVAAAGQHAYGLAGPRHPQLLQIHGGHGCGEGRLAPGSHCRQPRPVPRPAPLRAAAPPPHS